MWQRTWVAEKSVKFVEGELVVGTDDRDVLADGELRVLLPVQLRRALGGQGRHARVPRRAQVRQSRPHHV